MLARHKEQHLRVLVVWEPILPTDLKSPSSSNLGRIADQRARQFWDPEHLVAAALKEALKETSFRIEPACCINSKGFYWDDAVLYAAGTQWQEARQTAFWNGPVYRIIPQLESSLASSH